MDAGNGAGTPNSVQAVRQILGSRAVEGRVGTVHVAVAEAFGEANIPGNSGW